MSLPNVTIQLANGTLGSVIQTADGIPGLIITGVSEGSITAGTPFSVVSLNDAKSKGLTSVNNPMAYKEIGEFYQEAGDGALLYLLLVPNTMTASTMADNTNANGVRKLIDYAGGAIKFVGLLADPTSGTVTNGMNGDIYTAITNLQITLNNYATTKQWAMRGVIGGTKFGGTATALTSQKASSNNRVSVLIGDTVSGNNAAVGLLLGRLAAIPVQRKVSRVKSGALSATTAFIGTTAAEQYTTPDVVHDKGFITFRVFAGKNGYFFTGDPTCTTDTDDYSFFARGRVIDKAQLIAYATFVEEVDDEVPIDASGKIDAAWAKYLEQKVVTQLNLTMTANGNISSVAAFVDPAQNVLATNQVKVVLKLTPVGYASQIIISLGFNNPAL